MTFNNSVNASNLEFEQSSGTLRRNRRILWHPGFTENLGIAYNAGTGVFTVQGAEGTALSATNPAYVVLQSRATPGELMLYSITANQSFIDDVGASEIIGALFGLTTSVAVTVDVPFYLYAVGNDAEDTIAFMISRIPHRKVAPASGNIGMPSGAAAASTQGSFFSIDNVTATSYDANPCEAIGSFRMRMSASDDWTIQTLDNSDGIGNFNENTPFTTPSGQFGANAGTYSVPNGGTAAVFSTNTSNYFIKKNGMANVHINLSGDGGTDGSGAVDARFTVPLAPVYTSNGSCNYRFAIGGNNKSGIFVLDSGGNSGRVAHDNSSGQFMQWSDMSGGTRYVSTSIDYSVINN